MPARCGGVCRLPPHCDGHSFAHCRPMARIVAYTRTEDSSSGGEGMQRRWEALENVHAKLRALSTKLLHKAPTHQRAHARARTHTHTRTHAHTHTHREIEREREKEIRMKGHTHTRTHTHTHTYSYKTHIHTHTHTHTHYVR